ncbi:Myo-inositol 2-dehydrogenase [Lasiodiplodia theobromae]|uniref:Myo-inositol 2-dehydrogenase n=1 Tax=Lasiodiplodia theobromae TaxID=45133 RepID=UPI0015C3AD5D|nr:Myo-inositol 2-dehydrogenase [Lasiodiplodia theobromae]KAF4540832.1 Myo-inositol 2-dehydrogenase [Lasiodiplodia theobromae]
MAPRKLHVGIVGLGRMGRRHALNFLERTFRADVVAAWALDDEEAGWGHRELEPHGATIYTDYDQFLQHAGLEAVVIATIAGAHADQAIKAIERDKHVLCEKPLSHSSEISQSVVDAASQKPQLKVLCAFSRRFDASYLKAWERVKSGAIGEAVVFRSQTCDMINRTSFFLPYAKASGGVFLDLNIHDIDLCLWFLGQDVVVKSVSASGVCAVHPELAEVGDVDNAMSTVEFWDGKVAQFFASRIMASGQHDMSEIIGTKGKLVVNSNPADSLVEMHEAGGIRRELPTDYYGRFEQAFVTEANEFTAACLDDTELPFSLPGAVKAVEIAIALRDSLASGQKIHFDRSGRRIS